MNNRRPDNRKDNGKERKSLKESQRAPQKESQKEPQNKPQSKSQSKPQSKSQSKPQSKSQSKSQSKPQKEPRGMTLKEAIDAIYVPDSRGMLEWRTRGRRGYNNYTKLANSEFRAAYREEFPKEKGIFAKLDKEFSVIPDSEPYTARGILSPYATKEKSLPDDLPSEEFDVRMDLEGMMKPMEVATRKEKYLPTDMDTKLRSVRTQIRKALRAKDITGELQTLLNTFLAEKTVLGALEAIVRSYAGMDSHPVEDVRVYRDLVAEINKRIGAYEKCKLYEGAKINAR